jgi:hypothetical protein
VWPTATAQVWRTCDVQGPKDILRNPRTSAKFAAHRSIKRQRLGVKAENNLLCFKQSGGHSRCEHANEILIHCLRNIPGGGQECPGRFASLQQDFNERIKTWHVDTLHWISLYFCMICSCVNCGKASQVVPHSKQSPPFGMWCSESFSSTVMKANHFVSSSKRFCQDGRRSTSCLLGESSTTNKEQPQSCTHTNKRTSTQAHTHTNRHTCTQISRSYTSRIDNGAKNFSMCNKRNKNQITQVHMHAAHECHDRRRTDTNTHTHH